jgi:hypothetical protein
MTLNVADREHIRQTVEKTLSDDRLVGLYGLFSEWEHTAYGQGVKASGKYTVSALKGKTAEEYLESKRTLMDYLRIQRDENRKEYALRAAEEIGDFANMSLILLPQFVDSSGMDNGHIPLRRMVLSLAFRCPDFRASSVYSFDVARDYSQQELFGTWLRELEAVNQRHRKTEKNESAITSETLARVETNVLELFTELDDHLKFDYRDLSGIIHPGGKPIRVLGDCVTNAMYLLGMLAEVDYEEFFEIATKKMVGRDFRYHIVPRS